MEKPKFVYITYINSTPEKVFEALTNAEFTKQYWGGQRVVSDWKQGSTVKYLMADDTARVTGKVVRFEPPKVLCYTWDDAGEGCEKTCVTFDLQVEHGVTKLVTTHEGFEFDSKLLPRISQGWPAVLSSLKTLLESGTAIHFNWACGSK